MLYTASVYCIISIVCLVAGIIFYELFHRNATTQVRRNFIVYAITGLIAITIIGQLTALFLPLSIYVTLAILIIELLLLLKLRKRVLTVLQSLINDFRQQHIFYHIGWIVFLLMILVLNTGPITMDDTESYHIQMIKWLQEYGSVPGLANLHLRYGFNSAWFISTAIFSTQIDSINGFATLNGVLSFWFCLYLLRKLSVLFSRNNNTGPLNGPLSVLLLFGIMIITWPMIRGNATSANYDFITTCCVIILVIESGVNSTKEMYPEWVLWPCYLFTVRFINFPLLLLTVFVLWNLLKSGQSRKITGSLLTGALLIIPFICRNIILSGYAFFPLYQLDIFSYDWKADKQLVINIAEYVKYYNRVNIVYQPLRETSQLGFPRWIGAWYRHLFIYDKILVTAALACFAISVAAWKRLKQQIGASAIFMTAVLMIQLITWLFIAPDPRFAYGPLLAGLLLFFLVLPQIHAKPLVKTSLLIAYCLLLSGCLIYIGRKMRSAEIFRNWILPEPLPQPPVKTIMIDSIQLHIPEKILNNWNARCYGTELPCLYQLHPGLRARGKTMAKGFYIDPTVKFTPRPFEWY